MWVGLEGIMLSEIKKNTNTACNHLYMVFKKIKQLDELKKKKDPSEKQMKSEIVKEQNLVLCPKRNL